MAKLYAYFGEQMAERRRAPAGRHDDACCVEAEVDGERLSDDEIRGFFNLLATAGNETVTKLLASAFYWLDASPTSAASWCEEPAVIPNAVEELLRFDPPSQYQGRTLTRDVALHGADAPEGRASVMLVNGASGRDERRFPDPDRLDVRREIDFHLGFGYGRHVCLGAFLARMESRVALEEFFRRWPEYDVPADGIERMHSSNVRGFSGLVLEPR